MKNLDEFYRKAIEEKNEQYKSIILDLDNKCNELENEIEKYKKIKNGEKLIELQRNSITNQIQS